MTLSAAASPVGCLADSVLRADHQDRRRTHPTTLRSPTHTHLSARVGLCTQRLGQACGGCAHLRRLRHLPLTCGIRRTQNRLGHSGRSPTAGPGLPPSDIQTMSSVYSRALPHRPRLSQSYQNIVCFYMCAAVRLCVQMMDMLRAHSTSLDNMISLAGFKQMIKQNCTQPHAALHGTHVIWSCGQSILTGIGAASPSYFQHGSARRTAGMLVAICESRVASFREQVRDPSCLFLCSISHCLLIFVVSKCLGSV